MQDKIAVLSVWDEKKAWEQQHRFLWKTCFADPQYYEDFYFDKVYTNNTVYAMQDKGMVHVNWYRCQVFNQMMELPYIVGVSTAKKHRRSGVMRNLLECVFSDLEKQEIPFAYLMPAKTEYYIPFGFQSISQKQEIEIFLKKEAVLTEEEVFSFVSYSDIKLWTAEEKTMLFEKINSWLDERFDIYAVHDEVYFDLLLEEKACQGGDVIFCFTGESKILVCVFAYAVENAFPYVEQMLMEENTFTEQAQLQMLFRTFFTKGDKVRVIKSYPYMLRITHRKSFISLFHNYIRAQGIELVDVSDEQLLSQLLVEKNNIYFAEIV